MAESAKAVETFSTRKVYYKIEKDDKGKVIDRKQIGETPNVSIPMADWMMDVDVFKKHFRPTVKNIDAVANDIFSAGLKVKVQTHERLTVALTLAKVGEWTAANLVKARDAFVPTMGRTTVDDVEKTRRILSKSWDREVSREEVIELGKKYSK